MKKHLVLVAISVMLASTVLVVQGIELTSDDCSFSGYLGGMMYCYVGLTNDVVKNNLYSLNISQFFGQSTDSMRDKWEPVQTRTSFDTENNRSAPIGIVLPDEQKILLVGGYGARLVNQTIFYDYIRNSWQKGLDYFEVGRGTRQIFSASAVQLPDGLVGFYGGLEQFANTSVPQITTSGGTMPDHRYVGFTSIQRYSPKAKSWAPFIPQINPPPNYYPRGQTATLNTETGKVYYLGGKYNLGGPYNLKDDYGIYVIGYIPSFTWAYTFDTTSGAWLNETFSGDIPSDRLYHTANLLPNSADIILYGGTEGPGVPSVEYCFTLNLKNNRWTKQGNLIVPTILSGPRYSHSSILVNTTLFILFGKGSDQNATLPFLLFDVADVSQISYKSVLLSIPAQKPSSPSLSEGTIGGIAAGIVIAVLGVFAFIIYYLCSKRRSKRNKAQDHENEQMCVDWDKIDEQYREINPLGPDGNSPHSANCMEVTTKKSFSPVATSTSQSQYKPDSAVLNAMDKSEQQSEQHNAQDPKFIKLSPPDLDIVKPSIDSADRGYTLVKPDGD